MFSVLALPGGSSRRARDIASASQTCAAGAAVAVPAVTAGPDWEGELQENSRRRARAKGFNRPGDDPRVCGDVQRAFTSSTSLAFHKVIRRDYLQITHLAQHQDVLFQGDDVCSFPGDGACYKLVVPGVTGVDWYLTQGW